MFIDICILAQKLRAPREFNYWTGNTYRFIGKTYKLRVICENIELR